MDRRPTRRSTLLHVALFWVGYFAILFVAGNLKTLAPGPVQDLAWASVSSLAILVLSFVFLRRERRTPSDVGLEFDTGSLLRFAGGAATGFAMYAVHLGVTVVAEPGLRVVRESPPSAARVILAIALYLALSAMEELGFRGYALRTLGTAFGSGTALVVTVLMFALSHVAFGWPWMNILMGVIPGGLLFGVAALVSRGLAAPIGLHAAWNLAGWSVGEKGGAGIWTIAIDGQGPAGAGSVGTIGFIVLFLGTSLALWLWQRRRDGLT